MASRDAATKYRFSFGPWNISTGADPFGPPVRQEVEFGRKLKAYKELGFDAVQFHDDDIVPADWSWEEQKKGIASVKKILDGGRAVRRRSWRPRLWEDPRTIDGAFTSNSESDRKYALDRARRCVDIAKRGELQELRAVAGARGDVCPGGQGRRDGDGPASRRLERDPGA